MTECGQWSRMSMAVNRNSSFSPEGRAGWPRKSGLAATGQIAMIGKDGDFYGWLEGAIVQNAERATIDRLWGPSVAAWYKHGKEDPNLCLLMFTPREGKIWVGTDSTISYAWQMAKAFATGEEPDVSTAISVEF